MLRPEAEAAWRERHSAAHVSHLISECPLHNSRARRLTRTMAAARVRKATAELTVASWSRTRRRQRTNQAKDLSTTQRLGCTAKPFCPGAPPTMVTATGEAWARGGATWPAEPHLLGCRAGRPVRRRPAGACHQCPPGRGACAPTPSSQRPSRGPPSCRRRPSGPTEHPARPLLGKPPGPCARGQPSSGRAPGARRCPSARRAGTSAERSAMA